MSWPRPTVASRLVFTRGLIAAGACLGVVAAWSPVAAAQEQTIPAGATSQVAVSESNILATCTPPAYFHPNGTTWTVSPDTVQLGGLPDSGGMPPAGHLLSVTVPANHSPYQTILISWSGNTSCVSYNGGITLRVCSPVADPTGCAVVPPSPPDTPSLPVCPAQAAGCEMPRDPKPESSECMAAASLRPKFGRPASTQDVVRALRNALGQLSLDRGAPASPEGAVLKDRLQKAVSNYAQPEQKMKELWRHVNAARKEVGRLAEPGASRGALRAAQRRLIELEALAYALHSKRQGQLEADLKEVYAAAAKVADRVCLDFELERALPGLTEDEKRYYRAMSELRREKAARMARVASDACRPYDAATVVSKLGKEATAKILIEEAAKADVELLTDVSLSECVHVLRVVAALDEQGASALLEHSADPPDPRYRRLARAPKVFTVKVTGRGRSARAFAAWSRLLSNLGQQSARALGLLTAIERAQGAALAGDDAWLRRHESAGRTLALRWAALIKDEHRLRKRAARAFRKLPRRRALGVRNQRLLLAGNPTGRARRLIARSTGLDLWRELGAHAFGRGSGQQLPAAIAASPRETRVLRRVERSLQRLARRLG